MNEFNTLNESVFLLIRNITERERGRKLIDSDKDRVDAQSKENS